MIYRVCTGLGYPERTFDFESSAQAVSFAKTLLEHQSCAGEGRKTEIVIKLIMEDEKCEEDQRTE